MQPVQIVHRQRRAVVDAEVASGLSVADLAQVDSEWGRYRGQWPDDRVFAENDSWQWKLKAVELSSSSCKFFSVRFGGSIQGLLMLDLNPVPSRSWAHAGEPHLYVEYLESAPWNQVEHGEGIESYARVGIALLTVAVRVSMEAGCEGRIALHSLAQSEGFYRARFEDLGLDALENLRYFELRTDQASRLLSGGAL
jgi:hypothetical protein